MKQEGTQVSGCLYLSSGQKFLGYQWGDLAFKV